MRRFILPGLIVIAAVALLALLTFGVEQHPDTSSIDALVAQGKFPTAPASKVSLPVLGAKTSEDLASFHGKVVVLNVFASWCGSCASEAALLSREQKMLVRNNATLLGVTYLDNSSASEQFARRYHIDYPVLRDVSGTLVHSYGTTEVPETFVINRAGKVQALDRAEITQQWLDQTLPRILAERA